MNILDQDSFHLSYATNFRSFRKGFVRCFGWCPCCKSLAKKYKAEATTAVSSGFTRSTAANIGLSTAVDSRPNDKATPEVVTGDPLTVEITAAASGVETATSGVATVTSGVSIVTSGV